jgi:omega-6 fatty acid desaturase (delta-12 desaturase)
MQSTPPSRKALLAAFESGSASRAFGLFAIDVSLFAVGTAIAIVSTGVLFKLLGSALITGAIVRLFLIGHDACHGSFFENQTLNSVIGRVAFLPSMTAFSLWDVGHNVAHHGFNNLKGRDQVWAPFSKAEFDALPRHRQLLERLYRSGFGCGAYYLLELWWKKLYFASKREIGSARRKYKLDSALVTVAAGLWIGGVAVAAHLTQQSFALLSVTAIILPFLLWNGIMGFVVFVHHTHPAIPWFQKRQEWQRNRAYLTATANVRLPFAVDRLMHNIMEHNAHHVNPRIPMFHLRRAQGALRERHGAELQAYRLYWSVYMDCVRRCKLYDFANHRWLSFGGDVTSQVVMASPSA